MRRSTSAIFVGLNLEFLEKEKRKKRKKILDFHCTFYVIFILLFQLNTRPSVLYLTAFKSLVIVFILEKKKEFESKKKSKHGSVL